jgi:hypothetical protein
MVKEKLELCGEGGGGGGRSYSPQEIEKIRDELEKERRENEDFIWQKYRQEESKVITSDIHFS